MKCITVKQPWAEAIVGAPMKDIENRSWATSYRGPLLIHASAKIRPRDQQEFEDLISERGLRGLRPLQTLPLGCIVGVCELVDIVTRSASPWFAGGQYGWVLKHARKIAHIPYKGQLGLYNVPYEVPVRLPEGVH